MKFNIEITVSRLLAFIIIVLGFVISYKQDTSTAFEVACATAGVIIGVKTGITAWGRAKNLKGTNNENTDN
jgi:hypothetical protein